MRRMTCLVVLWMAVPAGAQMDFALPGGPIGQDEPSRLQVQAVSEYQAVRPGQRFHVAAEITLDDGWVYYSPAPGDAALDVGITPARLEVQADPLRVGTIRWPMDFLKPPDGGFPAVWSYKKRLAVYVPLRVPAELEPGQSVTITLRPRGQVCGEACVFIQPPTGPPLEASVTVRISATSERNPAWAGLADGLADTVTPEVLQERHDAQATTDGSTAASVMGFWTAMGVALLAGLALNIMPCVLPVIPIRILSLVEMAGQTRRRYVTLGLAFAGGMMLFFAGIALLNVILKLTIGVAFDINQGFQQPWVIVTLAMILVALAANLLGVFNVVVPARLAAMDGKLDTEAGRSGHFKSLGMGVMMAILATPCSFAFLAAALTYAQTASLAAGVGVILAVGVGMSSPHVLLAAFPALIDRLPRPGAWMEYFKQTTGLILLLVVIWLVSTLRSIEASSYPFWVMGWAVVLAWGLWAWGNWVRYDASRRRKWLVRGPVVAVVALAGWAMLPTPSSATLQARPFDWSTIQQARKDGRVVMVKFTATWCAKCIQQDYAIFDRSELAETLEQLDVLYIKADVSRGDMPAAKWMKQNGYGVAIPMTLVYPGPGEPIGPLRSDLTLQQLIETLHRAAERSDPPP